MAWCLILLISYLLATSFLAFISAAKNDLESIPNLIDPIVIYRENEINIFQTIIFTIVGHILFPYYAICYWLYKFFNLWRRKR